MTVDLTYCASSYCALRYVASPERAWSESMQPRLPVSRNCKLTQVRDAADILAFLERFCGLIPDDGKTGLLLSSGIDSAILAALLPRSTPTFTIRFAAEGAVDESTAAKRYADEFGLGHTIVDVGWSDYERTMDRLMRHRASPLHPVEPALFCAGRAARRQGVTRLVTGNGADSTFGGLDRLLSREWSFRGFVDRYTFLDPTRVLRKARRMDDVFAPYRTKDGIDVSGFLKRVHGIGIVQMFENALGCAECAVASPYEDLELSVPLDIDRIRGGEPKYLLQEVFSRLYPDLPPPEKIAFARPVGAWLSSWPGPRAEIFAASVDPTTLSGEQRWLLYSLDRFLTLL